MKLVMSEEEAILHSVVGTDALLRARTHLEQNALTGVRWSAPAGLAYGHVTGARAAVVTAKLVRSTGGRLTEYAGTCTCGTRQCAHPVALALLVLAKLAGAAAPTAPPPRKRVPSWEAAVERLIPPAAEPRPDSDTEAELALQFDIGPAGDPARPRRIGLRPVLRGRTGWVRSGVSWSSLGYLYRRRNSQGERHQRLLTEIVLLSSVGEQDYYGYGKQVIHLDELASRRIWDLLAEAQEIGLPLVQSGKTAGPVTVGQAPVRASLRAERVDGALVLHPELLADGVPVAPECAVLVGRPAHGIGWWGVRGTPEPPARDRVLRLAPLAAPLDPGIAQALAGPEIRIPARDERRFVRDHYPRLARRVALVGAEEAALPAIGPATLALTADRLPGHQLALSWQWQRQVGKQRDTEPLYAVPPPGEAGSRDALVGQVVRLADEHLPDLLAPTATGPRLAESARVAGDDTIRLVRDLLPRLAELPGVEVGLAAGPEYRELSGPSTISFGSSFGGSSGSSGGGESDWFDLAVHVEVAGEPVAFEELFVALAEDRRFLVLPSGAYLGLDRPEFQQLRELIEEARALSDAPPGRLRVGRFQAGMWQELAELGEITGQARAWQESVRALSTLDGTDQPEPPAGLQAELRPYQRDGYGWLATLHRHGLGGILADDMGLGKTMQALALLCRARESGGSAAPFLVVAPASVVGVWVNEAARFTPDLTVRAVTQTEARRGISLAEAAADVDLVVTSYTLFRLEHEDYQALKWDGLLLDEAQFVKNHQAQAHRHTKRLPAPFKLAITGTPMENNLAELWSLLSITAPGLFPRLDRFTEYYRNPIEKGRDTDRLAQLRRRVGPLLLRRRKADVAAELPAKQEQVLELELDRRHRRVYQTYLQRERQKVLGLLGEFERNRFEIFRSLTLLRQASLDVTLVDPDHRGVPSTKLDALAELVANLVGEGHRSLVFSQFTRFLGAARARLEGMGVQCCYLDGKTRNRPAVLAKFREGTAPVFLISLKAGGFGLNLTEADYCILLDPWWNPATEEQAVDRVHRIGQTRHVMVYRLVAKDTIEEKVMALKARKAELFSSVLDGGDFATAQLTAADIRALLE
ncbi:MAG: DEAD/DEAH box helicase [Natronosporangium sp.]